MGVRKRFSVGICIVLGLIALGSLAHYHELLLKENGLLKKELKDFIVPEVTLNDQSYAVEKGVVTQGNSKSVSLKTENEVLRIGYYSILNRLDPLFGLAGVDTNSLSRAVSLLATSTEEFAPFFEPKAEWTINEHFYPTEFLARLPRLEELRREVVSTPDETNVSTYNGELTATISSYQTYLNTLTEIYNDLVQVFGSRELGNVGGVTSNESLLAFAHTLSGDAKKQEREHQLRAACLEQFDTDCPSLSQALSKLTETEEVRFSDNETAASEQHIAFVAEVYEHRFPYENGFDKPADVPTIVLEKSRCAKGEEPVFFYIWWEKLEDDLRGFNVEYLNNLYFYDIKKLTRSVNSSHYLLAVKETGIEYLSQQISNLYMCPDQGVDSAHIATLYTLRSFLKKHPLVSDREQLRSEDLKEVSELEKKIVSDTTLYERDVVAYMNDLKTVLGKGEAPLQEYLEQERILYLEELIAIYRQKSSRYDELIAEAVATNRGLRDILGSGHQLKFDYFLMSRSYPTLTLLTFNPTVHSKTPSFLSYTSSKEGKKLLTPYWGELEEELSLKAVIKNMRERREKLDKLEF